MYASCSMCRLIWIRSLHLSSQQPPLIPPHSLQTGTIYRIRDNWNDNNMITAITRYNSLSILWTNYESYKEIGPHRLTQSRRWWKSLVSLFPIFSPSAYRPIGTSGFALLGSNIHDLFVSTSSSCLLLSYFWSNVFLLPQRLPNTSGHQIPSPPTSPASISPNIFFSGKGIK